MTREEAIKQYIMPALKRTWKDDRCIEIISAIEQDPICVVLKQIRAEVEEYKSRQLTLATDVVDLEKGKQIALEYVLAVFDSYMAESGEV